ncbi:hypothetical protein EHE19_017535 [Ruminiclostridium herbifermentans]|uniref:Right handed beta helix domain-containing protein n=2 Tax=Ruminiclostridium herbifermentans TaxID=2488810 RepID=A0A7H1VML4_9FIRM|nr:hypothetical protein EHE19_017535 [Ruminiclostridium herbifermentans]
MLLVALLILTKFIQVSTNINSNEIGNANFYNPKDQKYYSDKNFKYEANDNTEYIIKKFSEDGKVYIPKGNYLCKSPIRIKGKNVVLYGPEGACKIIFDSRADKFIEKGKQKSYIINDGYSLSFNNESAQNISINGIEFEVKQSENTPYNYLLTLANVKGGVIQNCKFISDKSSENMVTLVNLLSCCKNIKIVDCSFKNMTGASTGGCIWVRNLTTKQKLKENVTENISIARCRFVQNSGDEIVAVYSSVGHVRKVSVKDSVFEDYSDINAKVLSAFPSDNKDDGTVEEVQFDNNRIYSERVKYFIITVGGPNRSNRVSNVSISNNEITVGENSDNKCILIYVNDINTNSSDIKVYNNTILVDSLVNSTGIYNASFSTNNKIIGKLGRGIVFGKCYENIIDGALRGIVSSEIANQNEIYDSKIGISCKDQKSIISDNKIILAQENGLCGIEIQKSQENVDIVCSDNEIITKTEEQNGFIIHSGNVRLIDNLISGPGKDIYKSDEAVILK